MPLTAKSISVRKNKHLILDNISISLKKGSICSVIGPNGAGKSTLISALSGEQALEFGEVYLENLPMEELSLEQLARTRAVMEQNNNIVFDIAITNNDINLLNKIKSKKYLAFSLFYIYRS